MSPDRVHLLTPLTPAECVTRLASAIESEGSAFLSQLSMGNPKPVIGKVTETSLRLRKRIQYRNSFQSQLTATLQPVPEGTLITGKVAMNPIVQGFMALWFGFLILFGILFLGFAAARFASGRGNGHQDNAWIMLASTPAMFALGYALVRFGRHLARDEARFLKGFLVETLDARDADHPTRQGAS